MNDQLDLDGLEGLARAATPGPWTNVDDLRGEKRSVWVANTAREETESDGVTPSRYGPSRTTVCNVLASNYSLPEGGYETLDPYPNAAYIAAANPATVLSLITRLRAAEADAARVREGMERERSYHIATLDRHKDTLKRLLAVTDALTEAEASARRYAACYPEASDGRNTFTMLADHIATLTQRGA